MYLSSLLLLFRLLYNIAIFEMSEKMNVYRSYHKESYCSFMFYVWIFGHSYSSEPTFSFQVASVNSKINSLRRTSKKKRNACAPIWFSIQFRYLFLMFVDLQLLYHILKLFMKKFKLIFKCIPLYVFPFMYIYCVSTLMFFT